MRGIVLAESCIHVRKIVGPLSRAVAAPSMLSLVALMMLLTRKSAGNHISEKNMGLLRNVTSYFGDANTLHVRLRLYCLPGSWVSFLSACRLRFRP